MDIKYLSRGLILNEKQSIIVRITRIKRLSDSGDPFYKKNDEKCFLFLLKSSFSSQDI